MPSEWTAAPATHQTPRRPRGTKQEGAWRRPRPSHRAGTQRTGWGPASVPRARRRLERAGGESSRGARAG
eukprot:11995230-Alexandrium_andersonii.AAC.1